MKAKLKVLLISPYSKMHTGGIGTWSKIILDYAVKYNPVELVFLNTVQKLPKRQAMNHRVTHFLIGAIDSIGILVRLFWRMFTFHPDVVHYTSSASSALIKDFIAIWMVKNLFHKKFVIHWHFGRIPSIFEEKGREYKMFVRVCKKSDASIVIDERSYKVLIEENIASVYVPNPIPIELQREAERLSEQELNKGRCNGEVLFVGHVLRNKGIFELVQACAECDKVKQLTVIGPFFDVNMREEIVEIAKRRADGKWLEIAGEKKREDVWEYYKKCNVFCLPSYSEGFPYVILEAMAFGCPIVATKVGAIPEMLSNGCGELVEPKQIDDLCSSLHNMIGDEEGATAMGKRAHDKVLENFTINKVFKMYCDVWNQVY